MAPLSSLRPLAKWSAAAILLMAVCVAVLLYKDSLLRVPLPKTASTQGSGDEFPSVTPFTNIAPAGLHPDSEIWNDRPGVAVFDFDRDGDLDFYVTSEGGRANRLYQNDGNGRFKDVATNANVEAEAGPQHGRSRVRLRQRRLSGPVCWRPRRPSGRPRLSFPQRRSGQRRPAVQKQRRWNIRRCHRRCIRGRRELAFSVECSVCGCRSRRMAGHLHWQSCGARLSNSWTRPAILDTGTCSI